MDKRVAEEEAAKVADSLLLEDAVVEQNHVARSRFGIDVTAGCARVFLRGNVFEQVACPLSGDGIGATGLHPAELTEARVTTLGALVTEKLKAHFPAVVSLTYTAEVEERLDEIAEGQSAVGSGKLALGSQDASVD